MAEADPPRRGSRLVAKVYHVDPLVYTRCGQRMSLLVFVIDAFAIRRILHHLGLNPPTPQQKPPPLREVLRVTQEGEGWGVPAHRE